MEFNLLASIKLLSLNKAWIVSRAGIRYRSSEYKDFTSKIEMLMRTHNRAFQAFDSYFDPKTHEIHGKLVFYAPDIYTKKGLLSKTCSDIGNLEKCLLDNVLTGKVDDSFIVHWDLSKLYAENYSFELNLKIKKRNI